VIGSGSHIRGELLTFGHGGKIELGSYCYVGENTRIWSALNIAIGDRVLISHNSNIFDNDTHPIDAKLRHEHFRLITESGHPSTLALNERAVVIQDDVLVGCNTVVLKGVTIGEGAIVGAGSVVTRDVPAWTIVAGNPARVIREIGPDER
jgi:acetyltransferase-like isoleucine patch superfamily enzyme